MFLVINEYVVVIIVLIGVVVYFDDGVDSVILLKYVDIVMYCVKEVGCNLF